MTQQLDTEAVPEWTLGDRLRKAREMTGLDAVEFAHAIRVHRDTVANYEKGKISRPRLMVLEAWARRTGVSLRWLQTGEIPRSGGPNEGLDLVRHQGLEPRTRWFGRSSERRGSTPIGDPGGRRQRRRYVVAPLAADRDAREFQFSDNEAVNLPNPRRAVETTAAFQRVA